MGTSQALVLEQFLEGRGLAKKPGGLLTSLGAKLHRASELSSAAPRDPLPTTAPALDRLLPGGLPKGSLVELFSCRSSGRFSIALAALASATSSGQAAALIDLGDHLDPQTAEAAGVDLERLLWTRPKRVKEALAAAELLLGTGFPLVVVDLGLCPRGVRFLPDAAWLRLARAAQAQGSALLLLTPYRMSGIAAEAVVTTDGARAVWQGSGRTPRLLAGISSRLTLEKFGRVTPGRAEELSLAVVEALLCDPRDPRKAVEARVEAHDPRNALAVHHGQVKRVSGGQPRFSQHDSLGALDVGQLDRKDLVHDLQKRVEGGLDRVTPIDRDVAVKDLLKHLDVRDEALCFGETPLEHLLRVPLVGVRRAHEVHRDVRVEEDHRDGESR